MKDDGLIYADKRICVQAATPAGMMELIWREQIRGMIINEKMV